MEVLLARREGGGSRGQECETQMALLAGASSLMGKTPSGDQMMSLVHLQAFANTNSGKPLMVKKETQHREGRTPA